MADRITSAHLQHLVDRINAATNSPAKPWSIKEGADRHTANIGNYHLSGAYGGVCLHRMMNESGGVTCPLAQGHIPKRALYEQMRAMLAGIEAVQP